MIGIIGVLFLAAVVGAVIGLVLLLIGVVLFWRARKGKRSLAAPVVLAILGLVFGFPFVIVLAFQLVGPQAEVEANREAMGPFLAAIDRNDRDTVERMIRDGAEVNAPVKGYSDLTPVVEAIYSRHSEILKLLLDSGADANRTCCNGRIPLWEAIDNSVSALGADPEIIKLLLEHGAKTDTKREEDVIPVEYRRSPLEQAAWKVAEPAVYELLLEHGAEVNARDGAPLRVLVASALVPESADRLPAIQVLVEHGADPNLQNSCGHNALFAAISHNDPRVVKYLLEHGAKTGLRGPNGQTPMVFAGCDLTREGEHAEDRKQIIDLLLQHGSDINEKDDFGLTALDYSIEGRAVTDHLRKKGAVGTASHRPTDHYTDCGW